MVHGPPYVAAHAIAVWAVHREPYLRGRMLLAGMRWDTLDLLDRLDVAEAALIEADVNAGVGVDRALDALAEQINRAAVARGQMDAEEFTSHEAMLRANSAAESAFGSYQARELSESEQADRARRKRLHGHRRDERAAPGLGEARQRFVDALARVVALADSRS